MTVTLHTSGYEFCRYRLETFPPYDSIYECLTAPPGMTGPFVYTQVGTEVNAEIHQPTIIGCGDGEGCDLPPPRIKIRPAECTPQYVVGELEDYRCVPCVDTLNGGPTMYYTLVSAEKCGENGVVC